MPAIYKSFRLTIKKRSYDCIAFTIVRATVAHLRERNSPTYQRIAAASRCSLAVRLRACKIMHKKAGCVFPGMHPSRQRQRPNRRRQPRFRACDGDRPPRMREVYYVSSEVTFSAPPSRARVEKHSTMRRYNEADTG